MKKQIKIYLSSFFFLCLALSIDSAVAQEFEILKKKQLFQENGIWYHKKSKTPLMGTYQIYDKHIYHSFDVEQISFINGLPEGNYKGFRKSGKELKLDKEGELRSGLKDGKWLTYKWEANIQRVDNYIDGKLDGESIDYYDYKENKIRSISNYKKGVLDGKSFTYKYNGEIESETDYKNKNKSIFVRYLSDNELDTVFYDNGDIVRAVHYNTKGKLDKELSIKDFKGTVRFYDKEITSSLLFSIYYVDFEPCFLALWDNIQKIPLKPGKIYDQTFTQNFLFYQKELELITFYQTIYQTGKPDQKQVIKLEYKKVSEDDYWHEWWEVVIDEFATKNFRDQ